MADNVGSPLSDDERAELESLRAAQAKAAEESQARAEREELERLRKNQRYAAEDAAYYAEKARKKAEREAERANPDYSVDDLPPMPKKQKIVLAVFGVAVVVLIGYLIWYNTTGGFNAQSSATDGEVSAAVSSVIDAAASSEAA